MGLVFNVAQYAMLAHMLAHTSDMEAVELVVNIGDAHIYENQKEMVLEEIRRQPLCCPRIELNPSVKSIYDFTMADVSIYDHYHWPAIKYPVAV